MYGRNAASPDRVAIGAVVQISDGAVQTSGCTVRVLPLGGAEADGGGTTAYSTDGVVLYTPLQSETNYASFVLIAKKTGCIPASVTVVTTDSATTGRVNVSHVAGTAQTAGDIIGDTNDIQSRLPAALVSGRMDSSVGAIAAGVIAAASFAANALDAVWSTAARTLTAATNITSTGGTTVPQTGDSFARLGAPAGASVSADVAAVKTDTGNLVTRITSTLFAGITSLAEWLGLIAGKQTGNSTARTELRATGAGSGTYDETTDSQEAIRDRGDAAWTTAAGFSTLDAAGVRTAIGLANPDLDTQLAALPTAAENADAVWDEAIAGHAGAGSTGEALAGATAPSAASVADAVWEEAIADHSGTAGSTAEALNAAGSAGDPWVTTLPGAYGAGSAGKILGDNLNATVSSRSSHSAADVWAVGTRTLTSFGTLVADIWASATRTLTAISDSSGVTTLLSRLTSTRAGNLDNLDATVSSRLSSSSYTAPLDAAGTRTALGLASANLDTQIDALPTNAELATALGTADDATLAAIAALSIPTAAQNATAVRTELTTELGRVDAAISTRATPAQVNAECVDALSVDTYAEPASVPAATSSLKDKLGWLFALGRNKVQQTATTQTLKADDGSTNIATAAVSDDSTTFERGEWT